MLRWTPNAQNHNRRKRPHRLGPQQHGTDDYRHAFAHALEQAADGPGDTHFEEAQDEDVEDLGGLDVLPFIVSTDLIRTSLLEEEIPSVQQ